MSSSNKFIIANWKSNKGRDQIQNWMESFVDKLNQIDTTAVNVVITPPMPSLIYVADISANNEGPEKFSVGVQDISPFPSGSYTGAISAQNLQGFNVKYAIVGHSERRKHFNETHQDVANKISQALSADITPIVCIDDEYLADQVSAIEKDHLEKCVVAYEDLESIGTGHAQSQDHVRDVVARIKNLFGQVSVLYGGSVNSSNIDGFSQISDGVLVGGASLDVDDFSELIAHFN
jgi:triosephosphate isomerase (TIM)